MLVADTKVFLASDTLKRWLGYALSLGVEQERSTFNFTEHAPTFKLLGIDPDFFKVFPKIYRVSFVTIKESQQIVGHADTALPGGVRRWHVPIQLNDKTWSYHDGAWQRLELGRRYLFDVTKEHGAVNWGAGSRIHLLVDEQT